MMLCEVKQKIFQTDCRDLLFEGMSRSEPILTVGGEGLIDNFYIYASNRDQSLVSEPMISFGIYADLGKTAYINPDIYDEKAPVKKNTINHGKIDKQYVKEYEMLYENVRTFAYKKCSSSNKEVLKRYLEYLYHLSGNGLWENYRKVVPSFFAWVQKEDIPVYGNFE